LPTTVCTDKVVNVILAGWRYDISGIPAEMRKDYEIHLQECDHCRDRQRFHRRLDVALTALAAALILVFSAALASLRHVKPLDRIAMEVTRLAFVAPMHAFLLPAAVAGICLSVAALLLEARLPEAFKSLLPR
jgi:hypothetical protein